MPLTTLDEYKIQRLEILSPDGKCDEALAPKLGKDRLLEMYEVMVRCRVFDERAFKLQRQGRLGTYPQILGQEATQCIPPLLLEKKDWLVPTYRGQGAYFARGMDMKNSLLYWGGDDRGVDFPKDQNDLIFAIPVASHLTQAAGLAWASNLQKKGQVVLCYLGDGASSKGDFHEAANFAGVYNLPLILLIENNQWAISVPRKAQCKAGTLAQRAFAYGIAGLQVDGNDPLAVYAASEEAMKRARTGGGATVLECVTYRRGHHTTADDAGRYRTEQEVQEWEKKDPIARLEKYLLGKGVLSATAVADVRRKSEETVQAAIDAYEKFPQPNPDAMFENMYAEPTWVVEEQRKEFDEILKTRKDQLAMDAPMPEGRFP
jgi:pyruvate dehydrogenase E1 component alpha subunit